MDEPGRTPPQITHEVMGGFLFSMIWLQICRRKMSFSQFSEWVDENDKMASVQTGRVFKSKTTPGAMDENMVNLKAADGYLKALTKYFEAGERKQHKEKQDAK